MSRKDLRQERASRCPEGRGRQAAGRRLRERRRQLAARPPALACQRFRTGPARWYWFISRRCVASSTTIKEGRYTRLACAWRGRWRRCACRWGGTSG